MVVRFDNKALRQAADKKVDPIGVEGDTPSKKGGLSEADAIVREARKSLALPDGLDVEEQINRVSQEIIREEEEKEPGPELDLGGAKSMGDVKRET